MDNTTQVKIEIRPKQPPSITIKNNTKQGQLNVPRIKANAKVHVKSYKTQKVEYKRYKV